MMSYLKQSEGLQQEIIALDTQAADMAREIEILDEQIKSTIVDDEPTAKKMIREKAKLAESLDLIKYRRDGLAGKLDGLRADLLREKIAELQEALRAKTLEMEDSRVVVVNLEMSLADARQKNQILFGHVSNLGAQVSEVETELAQLTKHSPREVAG